MDVEYELPYLAHSPMEPLNCLADVRADGCDLWLGTQMQSTDRDAAARELGLDPSKVIAAQRVSGRWLRAARAAQFRRGARGSAVVEGQSASRC